MRIYHRDDYSVDNGVGECVAQGLTQERAAEIAQATANETGLAAVVYCDHHDDEWHYDPEPDSRPLAKWRDYFPAQNEGAR